MVVVGVALRTLVWWPSHNLFGVLEYDDGVYYAAARLLLDSYLPYSDFSIVHPPGVSLVLLPAAVFGYLLGDPIGMVAGRVEMQLVVALNIVLVYRLAALLPGDPVTRSRRALVAAALYAVMPNAIVAGQTILLEPLATCASLTAVWFLLRHDQPTRFDLVTCGMFLVAGVSLKLFALAYVVVVVGYLLWTRRPGWLLPLAGGGLLAMAVVIAPFVVSAPARAWHDVVVTQLSRARNPFVPDGLDRVVNMVGLADITIPLALVLIALLAVISFRRFDPQVGLWVSVLVITAPAFATSPTYFTRMLRSRSRSLGQPRPRHTKRRSDRHSIRRRVRDRHRRSTQRSSGPRGPARRHCRHSQRQLRLLRRDQPAPDGRRLHRAKPPLPVIRRRTRRRPDPKHHLGQPRELLPGRVRRRQMLAGSQCRTNEARRLPAPTVFPTDVSGVGRVDACLRFEPLHVSRQASKWPAAVRVVEAHDTSGTWWRRAANESKSSA